MPRDGTPRDEDLPTDAATTGAPTTDAPTTVTLRDEPSRAVAYLRRKGAYAAIPEAIGALVEHLQRRRLVPGGPVVGVFFTDPRSVPEAQAAWEVRMPLAHPAPDAEPGDDGVGVRRLPARTLAVTVHLGPYHSVAESYLRTQRWVEEHGYTVVGPPEEAYLSPPETPPEEIRTEVRFPVAMEPVAFGG